MRVPRSTVLTLSLSVAALAAACGGERPAGPSWTDAQMHGGDRSAKIWLGDETGHRGFVVEATTKTSSIAR